MRVLQSPIGYDILAQFCPSAKNYDDEWMIDEGFQIAT